MRSTSFLILLTIVLISSVEASHYRGGSISWAIREITKNNSLTQNGILVRVTQRHSWRRSFGNAHFCNASTIASSGLIGEGELVSSTQNQPAISATVQCTDFDEQFDYSSGEISTSITVPMNKRIEYLYQGCCWITLLPPDQGSGWSLKLVINTTRRRDGKLNNSPTSAMNPIVEVQVGEIHLIRIPMADSDGDSLRCRWGRPEANECGSVCSPKGGLNTNPCELTYNATQLSYVAVALVIEDFDSENNVLSSIPLQFLIHVVNKIMNSNDLNICNQMPINVFGRPQDACIGVKSNLSITERVYFSIPCENTNTTLNNILTISPPGMIKGPIVRHPSYPNLYSIELQWTPTPEQYGTHQLCLIPVDSQRQSGSPTCLTFQVDTRPQEFNRFHPTGIVPSHQSTWIINIDQVIAPPRRSSAVNLRFFKESNNIEVYRIDAASSPFIRYESKQIIFYTPGQKWEEGENYYILLDSGLAIFNESCGAESAPITNKTAWTFKSGAASQVAIEIIRTSTAMTSKSTPITTEILTSTSTSTSTSSSACKKWLSFNTFLNISTNNAEPTFTFCFNVNKTFADVTIAANTWVPCFKWKNSGAADPLIELYSENERRLLAENDDGNSIPTMNCYASVISYRLVHGDYRVVIRSPKCAYGNFELRFQAELPFSA